ncbi:hypothetical protein OC835_000016 [Tilletia horrida]|nr:hypothetical protein OC835_000016 [Tilletia horrida]
MLHLSNTKYNAVGLLPEHSMALPEREARPDELPIIKALYEIWTAEPNDTTWSVFAEDVTYIRPDGSVAAGISGVQKLIADFELRNPSKQLQQRILTTPEMLSSSTLVLDHAMPAMPDQSTSDAVTALQSLVVVRRRASDGLVTSVSEEEGHKKAIAPLAARAAAAQNFNSPTDKMVSPCTSKLNLVKKKHFSK